MLVIVTATFTFADVSSARAGPDIKSEASTKIRSKLSLLETKH
jgi:hypothetical protein